MIYFRRIFVCFIQVPRSSGNQDVSNYLSFIHGPLTFAPWNCSRKINKQHTAQFYTRYIIITFSYIKAIQLIIWY